MEVSENILFLEEEWIRSMKKEKERKKERNDKKKSRFTKPGPMDLFFH